MSAAARAGDNTLHGSPLGPGLGSANVIIGGMPAWRALVDLHACPASDGPTKPHGTGSVKVGSSKVRINNYPATREGDSIVEVGASNTITSGCSRVQIGG